MRLQVTLLLTLLISCSGRELRREFTGLQRDTDFEDQLDFEIAGKSSAEAFIQRNYERLNALREFKLQEKSHYLSRHWSDEAVAKKKFDEYISQTLENFYGSFHRKLSSPLVPVYVRDAGGSESLVYFPAPQISLWVNAYFVNRLVKKFPKLNIIYVDTSRFLLRKGQRTMKEVSLELDRQITPLLGTGSFKASRVSALPVCLSLIFTREHLDRNSALYSQLIAYSPMIKNRNKIMTFSPAALFGENGDFAQSDIFHLHSLLIRDQVSLHPVPEKDRWINGTLWREAFVRYDAGIELPGIVRSIAFLALNDRVIPAANSKDPGFSQEIELPFDHLESFYREMAIDHFLTKLEELIHG